MTPRQSFVGLLTAWTLLAALGLAPAALAVQPERWTQTSEADFEAGETDRTIITNLGDIKLAIDSQLLAEMPEQASLINDLQALGDRLYLATGPEGKLLSFRDGQITEAAAFPGEQLFTLDVDAQGRLLLGLSGQTSRLAILTPEGVQTLVELPEARYIWDMLVDGENIYLAVGTQGRVLRVQPEQFDAEAEENPGLQVLLEAQQANVLCLGRDAQGRIYAGTDTDGLIYRITMDESGQPQPFVIYDAPEPEIGTLLVMPDGTVFAGTADAEQARPGRLGEAVSESAGRPETPQEQPPQEEPAPDDLPQVPPEAEPIGDEQPQPGRDDAAQEEMEASPDDASDEADADAAAEEEAPPAQEDEEAEDLQPQSAGGINLPQPARLQATQEQPDSPPTTEAPSEAPAASPSDGQTGSAQAGEAATPQQLDRLRAVIRTRLEEARRSGTLQVGRTSATRRRVSFSSAPSRSRPRSGGEASREGNAVYRIDPQGFVTELFRESVMILRIVPLRGRLLVTTGNEGQIYSLHPQAEETSILADLEPQQIPAVTIAPDGAILLGTANPAQLLRLDDRLASTGTFTSKPLDASQISLWGVGNLTATIPPGTSITVETRSGNVADPEQAPWSAWSRPQVLMPDPDALPLQPRQFKIDAPPARFLQYRLTLTGDRNATPVVDQVELAYVTPNLAPRISSIRASYPESDRRSRSSDNAEAGPSTIMNVEWEASDPNDDQLVYRLEYQPAGAGRYLLLKEDLDQTSYEWETRRVPDGRYILRLTASDRRDNPGEMAREAVRHSDPVLVDNTPPRLEELRYRWLDDGRLELAATAVDRLSPIRAIAYAVNGTDEYHPILPEDLIFDSTREAWRITIPDLEPGSHVVTLRVSDARGNTHYEPLLVEPAGPASPQE